MQESLALKAVPGVLTENIPSAYQLVFFRGNFHQPKHGPFLELGQIIFLTIQEEERGYRIDENHMDGAVP